MAGGSSGGPPPMCPMPDPNAIAGQSVISDSHQHIADITRLSFSLTITAVIQVCPGTAPMYSTVIGYRERTEHLQRRLSPRCILACSQREVCGKEYETSSRVAAKMPPGSCEGNGSANPVTESRQCPRRTGLS